MAEEKLKQTKIDELIPDDKNFNKGTEYGNSLIEKSLRKFGAGRSVLIDKNNRIIAGNKTIENASAIGMEDVIVIDFFGGSGSTLRAAAELGRSAYGFEIDRNFYQRAKDEMLVIPKDEQMTIMDFIQ